MYDYSASCFFPHNRIGRSKLILGHFSPFPTNFRDIEWWNLTPRFIFQSDDKKIKIIYTIEWRWKRRSETTKNIYQMH